MSDPVRGTCGPCGACGVLVVRTARFADWSEVWQCADIDACWDRRAAAGRYCAARPDGTIAHLLTLPDTIDAAPALVVIPCPEHSDPGNP
jgi:hypothetical protein